MTIPGEQLRDVRAEPGPAAGRTGLVLRDALPWEDMRELAETAEDCGYEALFVPEIAGREAFAQLTGFAHATSRPRLGTGVVTVQSRTPQITAMAAATVHELSGGRMVLGLGAGVPGLGAAGARRAAGALALVRAYTVAVRAALAGDRVRVEDDLFGVDGLRLWVGGIARPPEIWLAALGDRMVGLAGEVADGVLLNWCTPERVGAARALIAETAERAGRDPAAVTVAVYVRACLGVSDEVALPALQAMAGSYASFPKYLLQFERMGLGEPARRAAEAHRGHRPQDVPASLVRALLVTGGRREAIARFAAYREAGADLVLCYPVAAREPFSSVMGTLMAAAPNPTIER